MSRTLESCMRREKPIGIKTVHHSIRRHYRHVTSSPGRRRLAVVHSIKKTCALMARRTVSSLFCRWLEQSAVQGLGNRLGKPGYRSHQRPRNECLPGLNRCTEFAIAPTGPSASMAGTGCRAAVDLVVQRPVCRSDDSSSAGSDCRGGRGVSRGVRISFQAGAKGNPQNSRDGPHARARDYHAEYEHSKIYSREALELFRSNSFGGRKGIHATSLAHSRRVVKVVEFASIVSSSEVASPEFTTIFFFDPIQKLCSFFLHQCNIATTLNLQQDLALR